MIKIKCEILLVLIVFCNYSLSQRRFNINHDPDRIYFPSSNEDVSVRTNKDSGRSFEVAEYSNSTDKIPLNFAHQINNIENIEDFLTNYIDESSKGLETVTFANRFGDEFSERSNAVLPKPAGCIPELKVVELTGFEEDPAIFYYPSCTRVERCGGCCSHHLLECQPTEIEVVNFQVTATQYVGSSRMKYRGKQIIPIEKHKKCKCDCKIKAEDCNHFQEYSKSDCQCLCLNYDEEKKCQKYSNNKIWDQDLCVCRCRDALECSTGYYYDQNECKCKLIPLRRRFANLSDDELKQIHQARKSLILQPTSPAVPTD